MPSTQRFSVHSVTDYLEYERIAPERHEFLDGNVYAMASENAKHSTICFNLYATIGNCLRGKKCRGYSPNMKVATSNHGLYAYPDLAVVCGEPKFYDEKCDVLLNPTALFEVLSPATEFFDRIEKFLHYTNYIETLSDYILISQEHPLVEHYSKQTSGRWLKSEKEGLKTILRVSSIECEIPLAELYDLIEFSL